MLIRILICVVVISATADVESNIAPVPLELKLMCAAKFDSDILGLYVENVTGSDHVIHIQCSVDGNKGDTLSFRTLQEHFHQFRGISIFLQIRCSNRGEISLPWPMKAQGLVGLVVYNCGMTQKYADFGSLELLTMPDFLRVLEIRNSAWLSDDTDFYKMINPEGLASLTSDYDCGQDSTIEYMVTSNVSYLFTTPSDGRTLAPDLPSDTRVQDNTYGSNQTFNISNQTMYTSSENKSSEDEFLNLLRSLQSLKLQCHFNKLKLLDESIPHVLPIHHFALMVLGATYPELKVMNYSFSGIRQLPEELQDFRKYFPKLELLDLSWNYLTEVEIGTRPRGVDGRFLTLDVRHNLISNLSVENISSWAMADGVLVDIRDNPIYCGCGMQPLLQKIQSGILFVGKLDKYSYIQEMRCAEPLGVRGLRLSEVTLACGKDNEVSSPSLDTDKTVNIIIVSTVAAVVVVVAALLVVVIVNLRLGSERFKRCLMDFSKSPLETDAEAGKDCQKTKEVF
ncbi:unnamed protein product [Candidula unifasciata]|uniref:LRRCT domain-containing protein n=1 Tax=Candidula unifasciata TaxID=100452 RepID=A0A8S3Z7L9_9EUPU|nr:unnamed protein product [Candidula unifasciata]